MNFLKKYGVAIFLGIAIILIIYFVNDCQIDRIMEKSLKDDLRSQVEIQKLEKKIGEQELKIYDIQKVKDEIIKENELLRNQKPKIITKVKYIKVDNRKYVLKRVFDDREIYWFNYTKRIQDQFDSYIKADETEREFNRKLVLTLKAKNKVLEKANLNLKVANVKLYNKAKGWLYLGWHFGYDVIHGTYSTGPSIVIPIIKLK